MNKRLVRCYEEYAVCNGVYNIIVFSSASGFGYDIRLCQCMNCGELYVFEIGDVVHQYWTLQEIVGQQRCVKCESMLGNSLQYYPETYVDPNGHVCHHTTSSYTRDENRTVIISVWEVKYG